MVGDEKVDEKMNYDSWRTVKATADRAHVKSLRRPYDYVIVPMDWLGTDSSFEQRLVFEWWCMSRRAMDNGNDREARYCALRANLIIAKIDVEVHKLQLEDAIDGNTIAVDAVSANLHNARLELKRIENELIVMSMPNSEWLAV